MSDESNAIEQAKAQLASIRQMVTAYNCDFDQLEELRNSDGTLTDYHDGGAEALAALEAEAGDCESQDDARQRIIDDALSVEVRGGWHTVGGESEPEEFKILLCTGGPAVQIVGELDEHNQPTKPVLQYQDWFTPWANLPVSAEDEAALLTYCQQHWFGE